VVLAATRWLFVGVPLAYQHSGYEIWIWDMFGVVWVSDSFGLHT